MQKARGSRDESRSGPKFVPDDVPAWKTELTEKLAASRARRSVRGTNQPRLPLEARPHRQ